MTKVQLVEELNKKQQMITMLSDSVTRLETERNHIQDIANNLHRDKEWLQGIAKDLASAIRIRS